MLILKTSQPGRSQLLMSSERDRFDKFTERARRVISLAHEEAQRLKQSYLGSEHILLGLLREGEGVAARVLQKLEVDLYRARVVVEEWTTKGEQSGLGEVGLTEEGKQVIEQAVSEAQGLNHQYVGTEHLLLALVHVKESTAAQVLERMGIGPQKATMVTLQTANSTFQQVGRSSELMQRGRDRFAKFNEQARKVLSLAQEEAQRFMHNYIGTEHLLLGLVGVEDDTAGRVLNKLGADLYKVRSAVEFIIGRGDRIARGEIGLTPRAKKVIELAVDEARQLGHDYIGTEHLLLGLVREGEGIAAGVLESLGVNMGRVRVATLEVLGQPAPLQWGTGRTQAEGALTIQDLVRLAGEYVRGVKREEQLVSKIQDLDDLVPEPTNDARRGNRFTIRARRMLSRAREEAQSYQTEQVGTEHLLLALIRETQGIAFHILRNLEISFERIQSAVQFLIVQENLREPEGPDGFTEDGVKAIELAIDEARQLWQATIGSEHILLGLLRGEGIAAGVLITRGLTLEKARLETRRLLGF
jgi:ATP-dependent Clp protease ATP-binding subunit ClpA